MRAIDVECITLSHAPQPRSSVANGLFATYKLVSEAKLQCKLNLARSSRSSDPTKVWVEWFAKVLVPGDIVQTKVGINPLEICMVEGVEHLR